jgi:two-component system sensor histidine kinase KdpD
MRDVALAAVALGVVTAVYGVWLGVTNATIVALTYLLVVLVVAALSALWLALVASVAAVLLLNYVFLPPVGTFHIADPENWVALAVLLVVSLVASHLSSSVRARAEDATARRDEVTRLFDLSRDILLATDSQAAYEQLARSVAERFGLAYVAICLPHVPGWQIHEAGDRRIPPGVDDLEMALRAGRGSLEHDGQQATYSRPRRLPGGEDVHVSVIPLRVAGRPVGLLATAGRPMERGTLDALAGLVAVAVERAQLLDERQAAEVARASDELTSALLASLAHDLRTPLTAIRVAASNLQASWASEEERQAQGDIVRAEVERLNRLFQNILDMARIETGAVRSVREWVTPEEIVEAALTTLTPVLDDHDVAVVASSDVAVAVDPRLTAGALTYLLENAAQYSPRGTRITVRTTVTGEGLSVDVLDEGPGIADADLPHLFERFFRGREAGRHSTGAGIGLALARGLLAAQGGTVSAANRPEGGAMVSMIVPAAARDVTGHEQEAP